MSLTPANRAMLARILSGGGEAIRTTPRLGHTWVWRLNGEATAGHVCKLIQGGYMALTEKDRAVVTDKGRRAVGEGTR